MKSLSVHGGGAVFNNTSCRVGRREPSNPVGTDKPKVSKIPQNILESGSAVQVPLDLVALVQPIAVAPSMQQHALELREQHPPDRE